MCREYVGLGILGWPVGIAGAAGFLADDQGELADLASELGDDPLGGGLADARKSGEQLHVLILDRPRQFTHRPDHRPQRLAGTHAVNRAEDLEKLAVDRRRKADQPGQQAAHHRPALYIEDGVQRDRLAPRD